MLSAPAPVDFTFLSDDDKPFASTKFYRAASTGSYGVTSFGRGFDWDDSSTSTTSDSSDDLDVSSPRYLQKVDLFTDSPEVIRAVNLSPDTPTAFAAEPTSYFTSSTPPATMAPATVQRSASLAIATSPCMPPPRSSSSFASPLSSSAYASLSSSPMVRTSSAPSARPRRRSSQQRVSLIAGRLSIAPMEPPDVLSSETSSLVGSVVSTRAPSPDAQPHTGGRSIADFVIEKQIGRGAYGLVKRAREKMPDGSLGPPVIIKLVIKQRILADCWKKHPKYGTIPIEIYVLSSVMNTSYILPARRPWDSLRFLDPEARDDDWEEGKVIKGHPNICPFLEFFEDNTYYYLVMPCTTPELPPAPPDQPAPVAIVNGAPAPPVEPPSDLFDLVEHYPQGLLSRDIRTYLGQIADALHFLHEHGIVHRDIKDENVILGPKGRCILIDFGSSGLTKKGEWDTFSGTLDYAGPEILRGQRYTGKPQDVWAFGVVAYVLVVGECPFENAEEAQEGLSSPFSRAMIALDDRCSGEAGEEVDGGGALVDAMALIKACLQVDVDKRPTFERILQCKFLNGAGGWS